MFRAPHPLCGPLCQQAELRNLQGCGEAMLFEFGHGSHQSSGCLDGTLIGASESRLEAPKVKAEPGEGSAAPARGARATGP